MKRMLFNATHSEELRVAIVDGQRLVDLDIETAGREQRKSNIYKGVVTRVEPSLEACFVNYGEERHGFLPFKEIAKEYCKPGVDLPRASIKDAISEGTELLVQVEKEERGNKGAALTTFISIAGRYLVLMPNNPRGGGVSRRIEGEDRQELKEAMDQLQLPSGMSIIARTAGIGRSVGELQWDLNYLLQLWKAVDDARALQAGAYLIYQESSLVIRAIRDYFQPDIGEILVDTDDIYDQAQQFMLHVMPDLAPRVKRYKDDIPLFSRFQVEHQIETAYSRMVELPSGGALVIDHTEALVAVDVNSARSTRGSDIEETALRTNLEAADEVGRQLRLRDLGGLIVIDFIDMESNKAQRDVEQRLREALHHDRARVQMGKISRFGLMELSRQRLRPALNEGSHITCPRCNGTGVIRDVDSSALHILRILQEEAMKEGTAAVHVQVPVEVASFLLNEKRTDIAKLEARLKVTIVLIPNKHLETPNYNLDRLRHDDTRLDDIKASYDMADGPKLEASLPGKSGDNVEKVRQEAVVKGIAPSTPMPANISTGGRKSEKKSGFFAWLSGLFKSEAPAPQPSKASPRGRGGRSNRSGGRGDDRRNWSAGSAGEETGSNRRERSSDNRRDGRRQSGRGEGKDAKTSGGASRDGQEGRSSRESKEGREPREGRESRSRQPREAREPRESKDSKDPQELSEIIVNSGAVEGLATAENLEAPQAVNTTAGDKPRRRRRRGPSERSSHSESDELIATNDQAAQTEFESSTPAIEASEPVTPAVTQDLVPAAAMPDALPSIKTASAPPAPVMLETNPAKIVVPEQTPVQSSSSSHQTVPSSPPAESVATAESFNHVDLSNKLQAAGLEWVQTDPSKTPTDHSAPITPPIFGRKPRRSETLSAPEELFMVETRNHE
ncbi:MAG: Rne/Rng family ribonuclease [Bordetella sp.]